MGRTLLQGHVESYSNNNNDNQHWSHRSVQPGEAHIFSLGDWIVLCVLCGSTLEKSLFSFVLAALLDWWEHQPQRPGAYTSAEDYNDERQTTATQANRQRQMGLGIAVGMGNRCVCCASCVCASGLMHGAA